MAGQSGVLSALAGQSVLLSAPGRLGCGLLLAAAAPGLLVPAAGPVCSVVAFGFMLFEVPI